MRAGGVMKEKDYPYENKDGACRFNKSAKIAKIMGFIDLPQYDINILKTVLATDGPLVTYVYMNLTNFYSYKEGWSITAYV